MTVATLARARRRQPARVSSPSELDVEADAGEVMPPKSTCSNRSSLTAWPRTYWTDQLPLRRAKRRVVLSPRAWKPFLNPAMPQPNQRVDFAGAVVAGVSSSATPPPQHLMIHFWQLNIPIERCIQQMNRVVDRLSAKTDTYMITSTSQCYDQKKLQVLQVTNAVVED